MTSVGSEAIEIVIEQRPDRTISRGHIVRLSGIDFVVIGITAARNTSEPHFVDNFNVLRPCRVVATLEPVSAPVPA